MLLQAIDWHVEEPNRCSISLLSKEAIDLVVLNNKGYKDNALFLYLMSKWEAFEIIVRPGAM